MEGALPSRGIGSSSTTSMIVCMYWWWNDQMLWWWWCCWWWWCFDSFPLMSLDSVHPLLAAQWLLYTYSAVSVYIIAQSVMVNQIIHQIISSHHHHHHPSKSLSSIIIDPLIYAWDAYHGQQPTAQLLHCQILARFSLELLLLWGNQPSQRFDDTLLSFARHSSWSSMLSFISAIWIIQKHPAYINDSLLCRSLTMPRPLAHSIIKLPTFLLIDD